MRRSIKLLTLHTLYKSQCSIDFRRVVYKYSPRLDIALNRIIFQVLEYQGVLHSRAFFFFGKLH